MRAFALHPEGQKLNKKMKCTQIGFSCTPPRRTTSSTVYTDRPHPSSSSSSFSSSFLLLLFLGQLLVLLILQSPSRTPTHHLPHQQETMHCSTCLLLPRRTHDTATLTLAFLHQTVPQGPDLRPPHLWCSGLHRLSCSSSSSTDPGLSVFPFPSVARQVRQVCQPPLFFSFEFSAALAIFSTRHSSRCCSLRSILRSQL